MMNPNPPGDIPLSPASKIRWKALILLAAVFVLGAGIGVGSTLYYVRSQVRYAMLHPFADRGRLDRLAARLEANLTRSLDLDAAERRAVHEELAVSVKQARQLRRQNSVESRKLVRDALARIEKRLPADKQAKLRKKAEDRLSRWGLRAGGPDEAAE
ncbi:MAG: hypothetical protein ACFUZC_14980 [Chthoniobacteraceae bacterium]